MEWLTHRPDQGIPRVYYDFNDSRAPDSQGRCEGWFARRGSTFEAEIRTGLRELGFDLRDGQEIILDAGGDCLEVRATLRFDKHEDWWFADFRTDDMVYTSEEGG